MKIKCPNCKYEWETKSKLDYVTCPNCQLKIKTKHKKSKEQKQKENI